VPVLSLDTITIFLQHPLVSLPTCKTRPVTRKPQLSLANDTPETLLQLIDSSPQLTAATEDGVIASLQQTSKRAFKFT